MAAKEREDKRVQTAEALDAPYEECDVIVQYSIAFSSQSMAEKRRIPLVVLALSPVLLSSAPDPPKGPSMRQEAGASGLRRYLRHSALFPRARIVAHHGGIGTSGQALKAGRPQLVTPYLGDQRDNTARLMAADPPPEDALAAATMRGRANSLCGRPDGRR